MESFDVVLVQDESVGLLTSSAFTGWTTDKYFLRNIRNIIDASVDQRFDNYRYCVISNF